MRITAGPRIENGRIWTFLTPQAEVRLDHASTDEVIVTLDEPKPSNA